MGEEKHKSEPTWRAIGASVRGASHKRNDLPNQDALSCLPASKAGSRMLLSIADGHGSAKYFRSKAGAECAVDAAAKVIGPFLTEYFDQSNFSVIKRWATEQLPQKLVNVWKEEIKRDFDNMPFTKEEQNRLIELENQAAWEAVKANSIIAYGTTILTVLVTEHFIIYVQLGDGDILTVSEQGVVSRPLPGDERLIANETTSLSSHNAWKDFRVHFQLLSDAKEVPALILLSTDGYANSFRSEQEFLKVGSDLLEMIRLESLEAVRTRLEGWLNEASEKGSGDDITQGIICRTQATRQTLTVSQHGGQLASIDEAIKKAQPDATIRVQPGLYHESLVIDKPLEIIGDGPLQKIVIESTGVPCLTMQADYAEVRNLTLRSQTASGDNKAYPAVDIPRGELTLVGCDISTDSVACIDIHSPAANPVIQGCKIHDGKSIGVRIKEGGRGKVVECEIYDNVDAAVEIRLGGNPALQRCKMYDGERRGIGRSYGIVVWDNGEGTVEDCEIYGHVSSGVLIGQGSHPTIQGCKIHGGKSFGIAVSEGGQGRLENCEIYGNDQAGIRITRGGSPVIQGCKIHHGNAGGVLISDGGGGTVEYCEIYDNKDAAVAVTKKGNPDIRRCKIRDGQNYGVAVWDSGEGRVEDCEIYGNAYPGVLIGQSSHPTIQRCKINDGKASGVLIIEGGKGTVENCEIFGNASAGVEINSHGNTKVRACRINHNGHSAVWAHKGSQGSVEDCDLTANTGGAWIWEDNQFSRKVDNRRNKEK